MGSAGLYFLDRIVHDLVRVAQIRPEPEKGESRLCNADGYRMYTRLAVYLFTEHARPEPMDRGDIQAVQPQTLMVLD